MESVETLPDRPLVREGLPQSYRMRADSHYVEQFDSSPPTQIIRVLPIDRITVGEADTTSPDSGLVESVRQHGLLQPLLVQHSRGSYRLIAGRKRLSAAGAAGMSAVPCLVHHVDDEEAQRLAVASNPVVEPIDEAPSPRTAHLLVQRTTAELSRSLARIGSCSGLLESAELTQQVLSGIVRIEACRSWCLANALMVLADTVSPKAVRTSAKAIARRVLERCEPERRARNAQLETRASVRDATEVVTDVELLSAMLTGAVLAALEGCEDAASDAVTLSIDVKPASGGNTRRAGTEVIFGVSRRAGAGGMQRSATAFADVMRQAIEKLAGLQGGRLVAADGHDTIAQIALPLAQSN